MIRITLCPNCRSIQRAGTICSICTCPVEPKPRERKNPQPQEAPQQSTPERKD